MYRIMYSRIFTFTRLRRYAEPMPKSTVAPLVGHFWHPAVTSSVHESMTRSSQTCERNCEPRLHKPSYTLAVKCGWELHFVSVESILFVYYILIVILHLFVITTKFPSNMGYIANLHTLHSFENRIIYLSLCPFIFMCEQNDPCSGCDLIAL